MENEDLMRRLDRLKNLSKKVEKKRIKNYLTPERKQAKYESKQRFEYISSKVDFQSQKEYQKNKYNQFDKRRKEKEMIECTFKPKLNQRSQKLIKLQNYTAPQDKKTKLKKQNKNHISYKPQKKFEYKGSPRKRKNQKNNEFYSRQLKWLEKKNAANDLKRLKKMQKEFDKWNPKANLSKYTKAQLNEKNKDFLDRVEQEQEKAKKRKSALMRSFDTNSFRPVINRNYHVSSKIKQSLISSQIQRVPDLDFIYS